MRAVSTIVRAEGYDMGRYHQESFGATSIAAAVHSQADNVSVDGTVAGLMVSFLGSNEKAASVPGQTILETARTVGVRIPAACESGICGTCKVLKRAGDVDMRHNGGISKQEIDGGYILACCSRPLSPVEIEA